MYSRLRHLLYCQTELAQLQKGLIDQDDEDLKNAKGLLLSRRRYACRNKNFPEKAFIDKIGPKLKEDGKQCRLSSTSNLLTQR